MNDFKSFTYLGLIAVFYFFHFPVSAQTYSQDEWHMGQLILNSGDTLDGDIKYDLSSDIVQVNTGDIIKTYSALKIESFFIADKASGGRRYFKTYPYAVKSSYAVPVLFEVVTPGEITLLGREKIVTRTTPVNNFGNPWMPGWGWGGWGLSPWGMNRGGFVSERVSSFDFYICLSDGETVAPLTLRKGEIYNYMKDRAAEIRQYAKENGLNTKKVRDVILLIKYYNALQ